LEFTERIPAERHSRHAADKVKIWLHCGWIPSALRTAGIPDIVSFHSAAWKAILPWKRENETHYVASKQIKFEKKTEKIFTRFNAMDQISHNKEMQRFINVSTLLMV
jgi:hypothetical protein